MVNDRWIRHPGRAKREPGSIDAAPSVSLRSMFMDPGSRPSASPGMTASLPRPRDLALLLDEQRQERALDRGLARRRGDLRAGEVGHVKHVDHSLAEGRHMRGADVERELRDGRGELIKQARPVEAGDLDDGEAV